MISIQYEYDILGGSITDLSLTCGRRNDLQDSKEGKEHIQKGDLLIRDLGYVSNSYLQNIAEKEAYFLNRLSPQMGSYQDANIKSAVNFKKISKVLKDRKLPYIEKEVCVSCRIFTKCRMVITRVPDHIFKKRMKAIRKTAQKRGYGVTDEYKARAAVNVFITNVPKEVLSAQQVIEMYKIRWQIELTFKVWKSLAKVNRLSKMSIHRFECQLLAKFIWIMMNWNIFFCICHWMRTSDNKTCSIWKFFKQQVRKADRLKQIVQQSNYNQFCEYIQNLFRLADKKLLCEKRKDKIPLTQLINIVIKPLA